MVTRGIQCKTDLCVRFDRMRTMPQANDRERYLLFWEYIAQHPMLLLGLGSLLFEGAKIIYGEIISLYRL